MSYKYGLYDTLFSHFGIVKEPYASYAGAWTGVKDTNPVSLSVV